MQRNGSETLLKRDTSPAETLTSGQSLTCAPTISKATRNAISSPASADGPLLSELLDGPMIAPSGPDPVPVSRFRALDSERATPIDATYGPLFSALSPSAALQSSLESRLIARLDVNGSPEYALTWKKRTLPAGLPICVLRASARRTSGSGFTGWPTPCAVEMDQQPETVFARKRRLSASTGIHRGPALPLGSAVHLAGWVSPTARDGTRGNKPERPTDTGIPLSQQVAETGSSAALNPAFSLWLMGYPSAWISCAPEATPSSRKSRRNSSVPV